MRVEGPISPHGIAMWKQCPYKFYLHYAERLPALPPHPDRREPIEFGRAIHEVIARYYELLPSSGVVPGTVKRLVARAFREKWPARLAHLRERAEAQLLNFARFEERRISWGIDPRPLAVEREYRRGPLHGVVDALFRAPNGELVVVDWKTGRGRSRLTEDIVTQMNVYLYLTGATRAYALFLEWGEWYEVRPSMDVESIAREILSSESFPRRRGPWCGECEYQVPCLLRLRGVDPLSLSVFAWLG